MRIESCFDSHVHWPATGESTTRLTLNSLSSPHQINEIRPEPHHWRGDWLLGFGWDDTQWLERPIRQMLDQWIADRPVALSRCDGHALWVNTEALRRADLWKEGLVPPSGGRIEIDEDGWPTGVLVDQAAEPVEKVIPRPTGFDLRRLLLQGVRTFNLAGFTHIRDMTCDEAQWNEAVKLDQSGLLTLAVEEFFWLKDVSALDTVLTTLERAKSSATVNLRPKGIKVFVDGALGSNGAWLSRCYCHSTNRGLVLWEEPALRETLRKVWERGFEAAVHAIGDEAAHWTVQLATSLAKEGHTGKLHIEHAELVRPETVELMKRLDVECHLQPSHWLSDRRWLKEKIGDLISCAFPWRRLQESEIRFHFGSDSPIEPADLPRTFQALEESAQGGIPRLLGSPVTYMGHPDPAWAPNSFTLLENHKPAQVVFRGEHLI